MSSFVFFCNLLPIIRSGKAVKRQEACPRPLSQASQVRWSGGTRWASKISAGEILIGESRHNPDVSRTSSDQPQHSTNNRSSCTAPSCGLELRNVEFFKVTSWRTGSKQPKFPLDAVLSDFQVYTLPLSLIKPVCFSQPYSSYVTLKRDQENFTFLGEGLKALKRHDCKSGQQQLTK